MGSVFRMGAYVLSSIMLWQAVQAGAAVPGLFPAGGQPMLDAEKGMVFGVCAGLSNYTGMEVTLLRLVWALSAFYRGIGLGLYILAFLIMPTPDG